MNRPGGSTVAIVLAAGQGSRFHRGSNKVLERLGPDRVIVHAVRAFASHASVDGVVVVAAPADVESFGRVLAAAGLAVEAIVPGGATRRGSEWAAIRHLGPRIENGEIAMVVIHDAARPLYGGDQLDELLERARSVGAAILAVPVDAEEGIRRLDGEHLGVAAEGPLWRAQTPQAFRASLLLEAFRGSADDDAAPSDTASTVEGAGHPVAVVPGTRRNVKITYPHDLVLAELLFERREERRRR